MTATPDIKIKQIYFELKLEILVWALVTVKTMCSNSDVLNNLFLLVLLSSSKALPAQVTYNSVCVIRLKKFTQRSLDVVLSDYYLYLLLNVVKY